MKPTNEEILAAIVDTIIQRGGDLSILAEGIPKEHVIDRPKNLEILYSINGDSYMIKQHNVSAFV